MTASRTNPPQPRTAGEPHRPQPVRTFHPRRGRMGARQLDALTRLWPRYGLTVPDARPAAPDSARPAPVWLDPSALFDRDVPLVLDIGFGMGEATAAMAVADPARNYLAVEVHTPGIANLLALVDRHGLDNVRVARGDAMELAAWLPPGVLDAVHAYFPDPWPKARHHKRRLVQPAHVAVLRSRLVPGGVLHCATDWEPYAASMLCALDGDPGLRNAHHGYAPGPGHRPVTRFERRAIDAGRRIFDLVYHRRAARRPSADPS